jgi:hypothetical protein
MSQDVFQFYANDLSLRYAHGKIENVCIGQKLHSDEIILCQQGLHASLSIRDAQTYAPDNPVLTKVKLWGEIIFDRDKLVATDREVIEIIEKYGEEVKE